MDSFSSSNKTNEPSKPSKPASLAGNALSTASSSKQNAGNSEAQIEHRPIFLLVWPSAVFKAHWAVFVREINDLSLQTGKYIHVAGSLSGGFQFQIVRGNNLTKTRNYSNSPIEIGRIPAKLYSQYLIELPARQGIGAEGPH